MPRFGKFCLFIVSIVASFFIIKPAAAVTIPSGRPLLVNYYLTPTMTINEARDLARWDVVILGLEIQYTSPGVFAAMRQRNPDIIILAYALSEEVPNTYSQISDPNHPHAKLYSGIDPTWFLVGSGGQTVSFWPGTRMLNVTSSAPLRNGKRWSTYLPQFLHDEVISTGLWDGLFYDNVFENVDWAAGAGGIDLNRNGQAESAATVNAQWLAGMTTMMRTSRQLEGDDVLILGNGGNAYSDFLNGRLFESFPYEVDGWDGQMAQYFAYLRNGQQPRLTLINSNTNNTGNQADYRAFRFGLTSTTSFLARRLAQP